MRTVTAKLTLKKSAPVAIGKVIMPTTQLTAPITLTGLVKPGEQVGRTLGFPTANLELDATKLTLQPGVYAGWSTIHQQRHWCLPYFGPRLVFGETHDVFEVYIGDFSGDLYGQIIQVELTHWLRPPVPFSSLEALRTQLELDKANGRAVLGVT